MKKLQKLLIGLVVLSFVLAACGAPAPAEEAAPAEAAAPAAEEAAPAAEAAAPAEEAAPAEAAAPEMSDIILNVTPAGQAVTTFTYNFNPFSTTYLFPTWGGIYEPLMINNRLGGELTPWLADSYSWSDDNLTLTFHIRDGVKWSDGEDFTSEDVVFTFDTLKNVAGVGGLGLVAVQEGGFVDSVTAPDASTVEFNFNKVYTPGFYDIINQYIVPEHIWANVSDFVTETNLDPVGTGPFTEVVDMQDQSYLVERNPNYWMPGQPYVKGLKSLAFSGNDTAATMLVSGDVDWTGQFFNNVDQAVLANNPEAGCWWPTATSDQFFMVNGTIAPFDDPVVRKAISMSFNRDQLIQLALQGKSTGSDVTGLSSGYAFWKADVSTLGLDWTKQDVDAANQMLDEAGYTKGADGIRLKKDGTPFDFELVMVNGFSDWLAMAPTLEQNLESIGFNITINNYDPGVFFGKLFVGDLQMSLYFGIDADTPYVYYRNIMSEQTFKPIGEETGFGQNMWRVVVPEAEAPLEKFSTTGDVELQKEAALELQQIFADNAPVIPLFHAPTFYCYNTAKVGGWATEANPFVRPMPIGINATAEQLIQMTSWGPKE